MDFPGFHSRDEHNAKVQGKSECCLTNSHIMFLQSYNYKTFHVLLLEVISEEYKVLIIVGTHTC